MTVGDWQPRAVMFDAVGTIMFADPPVVDVYHAAAEQHGVSVSPAIIRERIASALVKHFAERTTSSEAIEASRWRTIVADVFERDGKAVAGIFDHLWQHFAQPSAWRLFDDVPDCFSALIDAGYRIGIASNFDARLRQVCAGHPALANVEIFCSSEVGFAKPDPRFFRAIEQRLNLTPPKLALVGDDVIADHQGATAAGWRSIFIDRNGQHGDAIASLAELPKLLASA